MKKESAGWRNLFCRFFVCANKKRYRTKSGIFMGWAVML
jgi:hypothetical protein